MEELEQENTHLSNEHLVLLKKQENMIKKNASDQNEEQSTLDDTGGRRASFSQSEEVTQVTIIKDKQIDLLSSMLAQKEVDIKNLKLEYEQQIQELTQKMTASINQRELENQKQQEKIEQQTKVIDSHQEIKSVMNVALIQEQNKMLKNQVLQMHRQINSKDNEIDKLQNQVQNFEKKMVLVQKNAQQLQLVQKINQDMGVSNDQL